MDRLGFYRAMAKSYDTESLFGVSLQQFMIIIRNLAMYIFLLY